MDYGSAKESPATAPEVVLNLWAYAGDGGYIMRLAGRAYVMQGSDETKLGLLRQLAAADFLATPWHPVPKQFCITNNDNEKMHGVAHVSMLREPTSHAHLFGPLMDELGGKLPEQVRSVDGTYSAFRLNLPQSPLCVTTVVMEYDDGRLVPMVSGR